MTLTRVGPPLQANEIPMLLAWLEYHRSTLGSKCAGLSDEQLKQRSVPPSALSLLGLVRHMTEVERHWFRRCFAGQDAPAPYRSDEDRDAAFTKVDEADVATTFADWQRECEMSRHVTAQATSLDSLSVRESQREGEKFSLRWILTHMIEEYARHNGHADLLRECIDGVTGD